MLCALLVSVVCPRPLPVQTSLCVHRLLIVKVVVIIVNLMISINLVKVFLLISHK